MNISLEQAYVGFKFDAIWRKQQLCHHCAGKGGASMITCPKCHGHGTLNSRSILNNFEFSNWKNFSETTVEGDDTTIITVGTPQAIITMIITTMMQTSALFLHKNNYCGAQHVTVVAKSRTRRQGVHIVTAQV